MAALDQPLGKRSIHVVGVTWEPIRERMGKIAGYLPWTTITQNLLHLVHGTQNRRMFVHMALCGRKPGGVHPAPLLLEMLDGMCFESGKAPRKIDIFRCLKGRHARDKFAMGAIHVTVPKQVAIGPSHGIAAALSNGPG